MTKAEFSAELVERCGYEAAKLGGFVRNGGWNAVAIAVLRESGYAELLEFRKLVEYGPYRLRNAVLDEAITVAQRYRSRPQEIETAILALKMSEPK